MSLNFLTGIEETWGPGFRSRVRVVGVFVEELRGCTTFFLQPSPGFFRLRRSGSVLVDPLEPVRELKKRRTRGTFPVEVLGKSELQHIFPSPHPTLLLGDLLLSNLSL